jgi:hypothetical protein
VGKPVNGRFFDAGSFANNGDTFVDHTEVELVAVAGDEEGLVGSCSRFLDGDVLLEDLASAGGEWDVAFFVTFSDDIDIAIYEINMIEFDLTELGCLDPCIEEEEEHGYMAEVVSEGMGGIS